MSPRNRRPSLTAGILWTALGLMFLLRTHGIGPNVWRIALHYWPILLILAGLGKIADHYRRREGISLRWTELVGIVFLLVFGSIASHVSTSAGVRTMLSELPINIGGTQIRIGDWSGHSYSFTEESTYPIAATLPVRVENAYGTVSLSPGSDREIRVRLRKVVFEDSEARARAIASEIKLEGGPLPAATSGGFLIRTNRGTLEGKDYRFHTHLEIMVPKRVTLALRNAFGEVRVANLEGKLDLATTHRTLDVRDCAAEITASNRYADSRLENLAGKVTIDARGRVYVESIDGDVDVRGEHSPIEVRDVRGAVKVASTEGSVLLDGVTKGAVVESRGGNVTAQKLAGGLKLSASHRRVKVEDVQGDVAIDSRYATLSLNNVQGKVDLTSSSDRISAEGVRGALTARATGSSVRIDAASGPIDVSTTRKDVTVTDFASSCKVVNEYADVSLSSARTLGGEVSVKNRNGNIEIYLPDAAGFALDAHARMGRIDTDYPGLETPERPADAATLKTKVRAGGPTLVLDTEYGNVRIRSRKGDSLPAERPEEPRPRRVGILHRDRAGR